MIHVGSARFIANSIAVTDTLRVVDLFGVDDILARSGFSGMHSDVHSINVSQLHSFLV